MSCFWILVLFFGIQRNQRCCCERRNDDSCGCDERRSERRNDGCNDSRNDGRNNGCSDTSNYSSRQMSRNDNDCDCGCNDTFIQTRNFTNFQSQGTCGCEES